MQKRGGSFKDSECCSRLPASAGCGVPSALQGAGALLSEANPYTSLCHVRCCRCLSPAWGNRFCLGFPPPARGASQPCFPPPRGGMKLGLLPRSQLERSQLCLLRANTGELREAVGERELLVNRCCAKSDLGGEALAFGAPVPVAGLSADGVRRRRWEGRPWAAAGRGFADLVPLPPQSPGCTRKSVREV